MAASRQTTTRGVTILCGICSLLLLTPLCATAQTLAASPAQQVSIGANNTAPSAGSSNPSRSPNANITAFDSLASNLVADDTNGFRDVFVVVGSGPIQRVSVGAKPPTAVPNGSNPQPNGDSSAPAVSAVFPDKTYGIAFVSQATNLDPACPNPNGLKQVYLRVPSLDKTVMLSARRQTSTGQCIAGDRDSISPTIAIRPSPNRFVVAYLTDSENLVTAEPNDPYTGPRQRQPFGSEAVIRSDGSVAPGPPYTSKFKLNAHAFDPALSGNGTILTFSSSADNIFDSLVDYPPGYRLGNGKKQIWAIELDSRRGGIITENRADTAQVAQLGNDDSFYPSITFQGDTVAFMTSATNLGFDGSGGAFVRISKRDKTFRTINSSSQGESGNGTATQGAISPNGLLAVWSDSSSNLVPDDTNGQIDIFAKDLTTSRTIRVNVATGQVEATGGASTLPALGADGFTKIDGRISFVSTASNLITSGFPTQGHVYSTLLDVPPPPIKKNLPIEAPPDVEVKKRTVRFTLQEFSATSASTVRTNAEFSAAATAKITYTLKLTNTKTKRTTTKTTNRNRITISRLNPGSYTARYRATKTSSKGKKTNTAYSPSQKLTVS
jgi:hypothetical protein